MLKQRLPGHPMVTVGNAKFWKHDFVLTLYNPLKETLDALPLQVLEGHFLLVEAGNPHQRCIL